ncbi:Vms1/Ankzf1 family peptidyl-tRNA hydrolase [Streptomyces sp. NPDC012600]|uniref:baeRF2 domain-containing protein n=1 Tax=Streptomycetaceae TaxID=2062 RepID=UPI001FC92F81
MDRTGADLALRTASGSRPEGTVEGRDTASSDWSERHFQLSVENTWEENARSVASAIEEAVSRTGADVVVVGAGATRGRSFADDLAADNRPETGPDGAEPVGGLGAVLRWPTGGDHPLVESGT